MEALHQKGTNISLSMLKVIRQLLVRKALWYFGRSVTDNNSLKDLTFTAKLVAIMFCDFLAAFR